MDIFLPHFQGLSSAQSIILDSSGRLSSELLLVQTLDGLSKELVRNVRTIFQVALIETTRVLLQIIDMELSRVLLKGSRDHSRPGKTIQK